MVERTLHVEVTYDRASGEWSATCDEHPQLDGYGPDPGGALAHLAEQLGAV